MANDKVSSISKAQNYEEMADFWDTHSVADYADQVKAVEITFDPSLRRTSVGVDPELFTELSQIARQRRISMQTLVNLWLSQRVEKLKARRSVKRQKNVVGIER
jgi:hypothetical protein